MPHICDTKYDFIYHVHIKKASFVKPLLLYIALCIILERARVRVARESIGVRRVRFHPPKNQKEKHSERPGVRLLATQHTNSHTHSSVSALFSLRS